MRIRNFFRKSLHRKVAIILSPIIVLTPLLIIFVFFSKPVASSTVNLITEWGTSGTGNSQFGAASSIAIDASDNVYVADTGNDRIQKFSSSGAFSFAFGANGTGNGQFTNPKGVAVDPSGNVYVVDTGNNRIEKFDSSGNYLSQWGSIGSGNSQFSAPTGIAVNYLGNVYVADTGNNRVEEFNGSGAYMTQWGSIGSGNGDFDTPEGIAVDAWGNVYVADTNNDRVETFDSSGVYVRGTAGTNNGGNFTNPTGVAVDASGNVYVADTGNNRVELFDNNGNYILQWGTLGSGDSQFNSPIDLAINSTSNIFVLDKNNNRVQEFSTSFDLGTYSATANPNTYQGISEVDSMVQVGTTLYLGGTFGVEAVDMSSGQKIAWDPGFTSTPSAVLSLVFFNNTLYAGTDSGMLSFDTSTSTGTLTDWHPDFGGGSVKALAVVGSKLYAGGTFTTVDGNPRVNLATFDISTPGGVITSFIANTNSSGTEVDALKAVGTNLYVGGNFTTIGGITQPTLAEIDTNMATIDATFAPIFNTGEFPEIFAIESSGSKIYAGGFFTTINSASSFNNLASLDSTTGVPDASWTPSTSFQVDALAIDNGDLYIGEDGSGNGEALAYKLSNGNLVDWQPSSTQPITSMVATANALYLGLKAHTGVGRIPKIQNSNFANLPIHFPVALAADKQFSSISDLADIGGLTGDIFLAEFDAFSAPSPTPTLFPTSTPTPTPTAGPTATPTPTGSPTPTPTGTLTPTPTIVGSSSSTTLTPTPTFTSAQLTQAAANATIAENLAIQNKGKLPATGPKDLINLGIIGFVLAIVGAGLLFL